MKTPAFFIFCCSSTLCAAGLRHATRALAAAMVFAMATATSAQAANATWQGTTDNTWSGSNWTAAYPTITDTATFSGNSSRVNTNTTISLSGAAVGNIIFDTANAAAYNLGSGAVGSQTFTLGNGTTASAITVNSSVVNDQLFNSNITLGNSKVAATYTITNNSPTAGLTFAGNMIGRTAGGGGVG